MRRLGVRMAGICVLLWLICGCAVGGGPDNSVPEPGDTVQETPETEIPGADDPEPDISEPETPEGDTSEPDTPESDYPGGGYNPSGQEPVEYGVPRLVINELRTEWAASSSRAEYIEFKIVSAGNMDGLQVYIAGFSPQAMIYEFLPVNVRAGEYVVLHLRTLQDSCKDEYGSRLDESGGADSSPAARDFWVPGSKKLLHKTDAVFVLDRVGNVLDAVMLTDDPDVWLKKSHMAETAGFLFGHGAWKSAQGKLPGPADAVDTSEVKSSVTRSISRDETTENTRSAADWYVTETYEGTPGQPNTPRRPAM